MSAVKNKIDVILPRNLENYATKAGVELALSMEQYWLEVAWPSSSEYNKFIRTEGSEFFEPVPDFYRDNRLLEIADIIKCRYWGFSREYYEAVSFPVLQSFAHQLVKFRSYLEELKGAFEARSIRVGWHGTTESGLELQDGRAIVWFVKYGVGRFALDLRDISVETARTFNFLGRPLEYGHEQERAALKSLDIYPIATVAENRYSATLEFADGIHDSSEYDIERCFELEAQWKLNDKYVLPRKLIKVNLVESPQGGVVTRKVK